MNVFGTTDLDLRRPDVLAIVEQHGLSSVTHAKHPALRAWLVGHGYDVVTVECAGGFDSLLAQLDDLFSWEAQFGYRLSAGSANLDALRDGFGFRVPADRGVVMELVGLDAVYRSHPQWTLGMLSIASEHATCQLAMGRRFFALVVVEESSALVGATVAQVTVPAGYWHPSGKLPE